ncbi:MAG: peroxiredoxin [Paracoccaceae bacterium]|nr:peroxiredoxin [Paracoccaceae bacterium]
MTLSVGDKVPEATLIWKDSEGPHEVELSDKLKGRKVVLFGLPGAFTGTCTTSHIPSFIRTAEAFRDKGIDEIICVSVNDAFVMEEWGKATGATEAGITMLCDPTGAYARKIGMQFDAPPVGLMGRLERHAMIVDNGVVEVLEREEPGVCSLTGGEALLEKV